MAARSDQVVVYSSLIYAQAYLVYELLVQEGVRAGLSNAHRAALFGQIPADDARVEVWVAPDQQILAEKILARSARPATEEWHCAACGELNPESFEVCWACGHEL